MPALVFRSRHPFRLMRMKSSTASKEGFRAEKDVKEESLQQDSASPSNTCTVEEKAQRMGMFSYIFSSYRSLFAKRHRGGNGGR